MGRRERGSPLLCGARRRANCFENWLLANVPFLRSEIIQGCPGCPVIRVPNGNAKCLHALRCSVDRALAAEHRLPAVYPFDFFARNGGLMSYGADVDDLFRRAASYVDRILKGAKPSDLPVQAPTKFQFIINLKTAKTLGLTVPPTLLATADEVIE